jgi:hypothetical protein
MVFVSAAGTSRTISSFPQQESFRRVLQIPLASNVQSPDRHQTRPKPDGTSILTTKVASGSGGFRPGVLSENSSQVLSKEQTQMFLKRVNELRFWEAPNPVNDQRGTDGSQWIIEGVKRGRYHVVDRWYPRDGVARQLGFLLAFDLAKINLPNEEIY